ncbi:MAG: hypothetical protein PHE33_04895 [Bacteroidales bacterium]|nr:hypothetical protein [Bacteroidales bacterium]
MKKIFFILLFSILISTLSYADSLKLIGNVGGYKIEMFIDSSDFETGEFTGKYRYLSQTNFLDIKGQNYGNVLYIEEFYNDKQTGTFLLEVIEDKITGWWYNDTKTLKADLFIQEGNNKHLIAKNLDDYNAECSDEISGKYEVDYYYINDYWTTEEKQSYELGYGGGSAKFEEQVDGSLKFEIELICGPTYHFATAEGVAVKKDDVYIYSESLYGDEACEITFKFDGKSVYAVANDGLACGFGMRAYIDHKLIKVKD